MIWRKHAILTPPTDEEMVQMEPDELIGLHSVYHEAIENAEKDPYHYGFRLPHWNKAEEQLFEVNEILALGGNRCLGGEQEIYDPVSKTSTKVSEIKGLFHVHAWDGHRIVEARAETPFQKPVSGIYQVTLSNGDSLCCSMAHLLLTPSGWKPLSSLLSGSPLVNAQTRYLQVPSPSIWGLSLQGFGEGVRRCFGKAQDWMRDCLMCCYQCDERPRLLLKDDQELTPLHNDAPKRNAVFENIGHWLFPLFSCSRADKTDGLERKSLRNRFCKKSFHCSIQDGQNQIEDHSFDIVCCDACKPCRLVSPESSGQLISPTRQQPIAGFFLLQSIVGFVQRGILYFLPCMENALFPPEVKIKSIDYLRDDIVWDFHVPIHNNYVAAGVISHNSGKTQWGAFSVVRAAIENPKSEIFCFAQTSEVSIRQQQSAVWDWLPENLKTKQTSANTYISYKKKTGFTDSSLILPNGSQIIFKTYSQYQNNPTILEGAELGSKNHVWHNIGVWLDEYLLGPELINTLRFRLATRNAKMLVTFTPIDGWTEVIKEYLDGATTIESRPAELLNGELVPYVQKSKKLNASVHYFHSQDNAFGGYERIKETLSGRTREEILIRAYGVPMKSHATKFPKFNKVVNVVPPASIPTKNITRYHVIDPAGAKNWFMCWIAIDESGTFWVYREWPGVDVGDWAEWKGGKWMPGPGAKGQGFGIRDYIEAIQEMEGDEEIFERLIDPRLGAAKYQAQDGSSSIIEDLNESGMVCIPAPGLDIDDGLQALIGKMSWDTARPLDSVNRPHFYVSSDCENIIQALSEYTGEGGLKEAWKDPIDVCRYAAIANLDHVDNDRSFVTTHGSGGY